MVISIDPGKTYFGNFCATILCILKLTHRQPNTPMYYFPSTNSSNFLHNESLFIKFLDFQVQIPQTPPQTA
ncbi:hypothetical protein CICLE_v10029745mg [Citrus x clementina]|uniref:Uncharacterized protein n=1 Tax=Citrus clementina TaxID=85681 RepID=V4SD34_CITCL|nr:hypothetical protein CICLE_v10029745mg [Citrus x clementina]